MKTFPKVGDQGYLRQFTGSYYVDMVKRPYTVIKVEGTKVTVQEAALIFPIFHYDPKSMSEYYKEFDGKRICFYDTVAESVEPNPEGRIKILTWHPKKELWGTSNEAYPEFLILGEGYQHQPYLD